MATFTKKRTRDGQLRHRAQIRLRGESLSETFSTLSAARRWARKVEDEIREGTFRKSADKPLGAVIEEYIAEEVPRKRAGNKTRQQLLWWRARLGRRKLSELRGEHGAALIAAELRTLTQGGRSPATSNRYRSALSHLFTVAIQDWHLLAPADNPFLVVRRKSEPPGRTRWLAHAHERKALLEACKRSPCADLYPVVLMAIQTGARQGEILNLRWSDLDLNKGWALVQNTKNTEPRVLHLSPPVVALLRQRPRHLHTDLVFPEPATRPGEPARPRYIRWWWRQACQQAGIENFRFHDLRHTAASLLARYQGATASELKDFLGHKTLAMVARYTHLSREHIEEKARAMQAEVFGD